MANITHANLLGSHPSVQDLNIATSPTVNNPTKQSTMQHMQNLNANFVGDNFTPTKRGGQLLCAPTGGPRVVAVRNEEAIRKGVVLRPMSKDITSSGRVGRKNLASNNNTQHVKKRPLAQEERDVNVPPLYSTGSNASSNNKNNNNNNNLATTNSAKSQAEKLRQMSLPQLVKLAERRRKPDARTPSEISLVTSVESRDASTNHPCSATVYSCECCRPKKPGTFGTAVGGASSVIASAFAEEDDMNDDDSLYDNLTSVSQRGEHHHHQQQHNKLLASSSYALPPKAQQSHHKMKKQSTNVTSPEKQITARQIFELQQAKAAASGSYGHNLIANPSTGRKAMGFGLQSQKVMDHVTNRGLSARTAASDVSSLTHTSMVTASKNNNNTKNSGGENDDDDRGSRVSNTKNNVRSDDSVVSGSRFTSSSSKVSSRAVRQLEAALEQERVDRLKTEEQISRIRERQERLMRQLTPEERKRMQELIGNDE